MLKIKLARFGKRGQPHYRIVITEQHSKRDGQYVEAIGTYAPTQAGKPLNLDTVKYNAWIKKGAQPTPTVASLYNRANKQKPHSDSNITPVQQLETSATPQPPVKSDKLAVSKSTKPTSSSSKLTTKSSSKPPTKPTIKTVNKPKKTVVKSK